MLHVGQWEAQQWVVMQLGPFLKLWTGRAERANQRKPYRPRDRTGGATRVIPLATTYSLPFTSLCVHKGELIRVPHPFHPSMPPPPPLPFITRRSQVLQPHNKNLPPWPNNNSRPEMGDHLRSIWQRIGDLIPLTKREQSEAQKGLHQLLLSVVAAKIHADKTES